jgi:hypothetical protein
MPGSSHRLVCGLVFHSCYVQTTESADCRNIMPRPPTGIPSHFPDPGSKWQAEFNSQVPHQLEGTAGAAPLKFPPLVNDGVFLPLYVNIVYLLF